MKMFTLDFKEKTENLVNLPNKRATDILELLKLIYPNYDFDLDDVEGTSFLSYENMYHSKSLFIFKMTNWLVY